MGFVVPFMLDGSFESLKEWEDDDHRRSSRGQFPVQRVLVVGGGGGVESVVVVVMMVVVVHRRA
jgi:hypothetical protein